MAPWEFQGDPPDKATVAKLRWCRLAQQHQRQDWSPVVTVRQPGARSLSVKRADIEKYGVTTGCTSLLLGGRVERASTDCHL